MSAVPSRPPAPSRLELLDELSEDELDEVVSAATWYAKYHERMIADLADNQSAMAVARRERAERLHSGLRKLGVLLRRPV